MLFHILLPVIIACSFSRLFIQLAASKRLRPTGLADTDDANWRVQVSIGFEKIMTEFEFMQLRLRHLNSALEQSKQDRDQEKRRTSRLIDEFQRQQTEMSKFMEEQAAIKQILIAGFSKQQQLLEALKAADADEKIAVIQRWNASNSFETTRELQCDSSEEQRRFRELVVAGISSQRECCVKMRQSVDDAETRLVAAVETGQAELQRHNANLRQQLQDITKTLKGTERRQKAVQRCAKNSSTEPEEQHQATPVDDQTTDGFQNETAVQFENDVTPAMNGVGEFSSRDAAVADVVTMLPDYEPTDDAKLKPSSSAVTPQPNEARLNQTLNKPGFHAKGLALFNSQLFVSWRSWIRTVSSTNVYNVSSTLTLDRSLVIGETGCTEDMTSCRDCDAVYLADSCSNMIYVIDNRQLRTNWRLTDKPAGLSVNSRQNVIVTTVFSRQLLEYTPSGQLVREVTLQSDVSNPSHAVQLDDNRFVVAHGAFPVDLHRVCIVDGRGTVVHSHGAEQGSGTGQLNRPTRLAVFGAYVLVLDSGNGRVALFDSRTLAYVRTLVAVERRSERMTLSEDGSRLYVTDLNVNVGVFDLSWH